ncbi:MAG: sensor signal transduction histidine kinase [Tardiphaga sp.]|nr:sensor signal transduction histidine kinase [Tardiphaga sp.]
MTTADPQQRGVSDARLAVHATSHLPAWLWSPDGARILWANPVGAALFGARHGPDLAAKPLGPADARRRQIAQLARRLRPDGGVRLERLRGFGAPLGRLLACACSRIDFSDGQTGILVVAAERVGRPMPLLERLQHLVEGVDTPIAAFGRDGLFVSANDAARTLMAFRTLSEAGLEAARNGALRDGRVEMPIGIGQIVLQRVGSGADVGLVALFAPGPPPPPPKPLPEQEPVVATPAEPIASVADLPEPRQVFVDAFAQDVEADLEPDLEPVAEPAADPEDHPRPTLAESSEPQSYTDAADESGDLVVEPFADAVPEPEPDETTRPETAPIEPAPAPTVSDDQSAAIASFLRADAPAETGPRDDTDDVGVLDAAVESFRVQAEPDAHKPDRATPGDQAPAQHDALAPAPTPRRNPLRFTWAIDDAGRFTLRSDDFIRLIGPNMAARFGRPWPDVADDLKLDPDHRLATALTSQTTWSGVQVNWPVDPPGESLTVEMAGLPVFNADGAFTGYRGFGVARDLDALGRLDAIRDAVRHDDAPVGDQQVEDSAPPRSLSAQANPHHDQTMTEDPADAIAPTPSSPIEPMPVKTSDLVAPQNVVPIRPLVDPFAAALTPVENSAFNELARRLSERLDNDDVGFAETSSTQSTELAETATPLARSQDADDWLSRPPTLAQGTTSRDRPLLDLMPAGILVYRLDRLLYANPAFLARTGHADLAALEAAGGLDSLYIEPGVSTDSSSAGTGTRVTIAAKADQPPAAADLSSISWDGEPALALIFALAPAESAMPHVIDDVAPTVPPLPVPGQASAEDLAAILDTAAEGIVMFDMSGRIHSCNRSAEALFGRDGATLTTSVLVDLFAPESQRDVRDYFDAVVRADTSNLHGREVLGRVPSGGLLPLAITMGRTTPDGPNFFAIFRDQSQARKIDSELLAARKQADRFVSAKADVLARISHEIRTPLNAIIGFSDVMISERFGPLGNPRYGDYMKDIRACGERVIAIIDDMLNLAKIETGDLDLAFASQNLNELVEQCVAVMQPQANRERIIIRTSLAHHLPPVQADARALRQITLNLISNSIHLANAGGQVIVSTAMSDLGDIVLRVRDTGHGLNDNEIAAAMEPFRTRAPADRGPDTAGVNLSLTRALVEANRAQFNIKTAPQSGTLIEVVFSVRAGATA